MTMSPNFSFQELPPQIQTKVPNSDLKEAQHTIVSHCYSGKGFTIIFSFQCLAH